MEQETVSVPIRWRSLVFHPLTVIGISFIAALLFTLLVMVGFEGHKRFFLLYYVMPVGIPFVAYLFDRAARWHEQSLARLAIDFTVVSLSLTRAVIMVPLISGHALFLTYALLTAQTWIVRIMAIVVILQVSYLKLFVWHDITLLGGIILGYIAALGFQKVRKEKSIVA
jgi:hypothetical protein